MIEAIDLTVRRRGRAVLEAVSFDVRPGQVTGVLGGTGAGKSTLLRRMVQLDRGGGETLFDGRTYRSLVHPLREVGLVLGEAAGYPDHTVQGHLRLVLATDRRAAREPGTRTRLPRSGHGGDAGVVTGERFGSDGEGVLAVRDAAGNRIAVRSGMSGDGARLSGDRGDASRGRTRPSRRIDAVLEIVGLSGQRRTRLSELTDGMATRLAIAAALLGDPKALLLDCPDRGLEPEGVVWLGELLRAFTRQGRAALVTCANTETLVSLADRILLLDSGYLVGTRTAEEVLRAPTGSAVIVRSPQILRFAALLSEAGARSSQGEGASLEVRGLDRARIGDLAYRHGIPLHELAERFTGADPGDVVLAACSGRGRAVVPLQAVASVGAAASVGVDAGLAAARSESARPEVVEALVGVAAARGEDARAGASASLGATSVSGGAVGSDVAGASAAAARGEDGRAGAGAVGVPPEVAPISARASGTEVAGVPVSAGAARHECGQAGVTSAPVGAAATPGGAAEAASTGTNGEPAGRQENAEADA